MKRIAYLAPELPSLSATFVYNEILALQKINVDVHTYSVHQPKSEVVEQNLQAIKEKTLNLYQQPFSVAAKSLLKLMFTHKRSFLKATFYLVKDLIKTGLITKTSMKLIYQYLYGALLAVDIRKKNIEHLHIHFAHVPTQIGMYAATLAGIPFTFTAHANDIFERALLMNEKLKRAKKFITISQYNINRLNQQNLPMNTAEIIRCGVNSSLPIKSQSNNQPIKIGSIGRLVEKKGMDTMIDALHSLNQQGVNFILEIAGAGPLYNQLNQQVKELNLSKKVKFLGAVAHDDILEWLQSLDLFILASKKDKNGDMDGVPVVLMEAMNIGVPVISTKISGIPELIENEENGLLVEPTDSQELAKAIQDLLTKPEKIEKFIKQAKTKVQKEFDIDKNAQKLNEIFNS